MDNFKIHKAKENPDWAESQKRRNPFSFNSTPRFMTNPGRSVTQHRGQEGSKYPHGNFH
jgi:hypothetical protein